MVTGALSSYAAFPWWANSGALTIKNPTTKGRKIGTFDFMSHLKPSFEIGLGRPLDSVPFTGVFLFETITADEPLQGADGRMVVHFEKKRALSVPENTVYCERSP